MNYDKELFKKADKHIPVCVNLQIFYIFAIENSRPLYTEYQMILRNISLCLFLN